MEAVGRLAGGIAHDFNNLLTVINGYSAQMLESESLSVGDRLFVERVALAGDKAARLTHQLLAFSKTQLLKPRTVSMNSLLSEMEPLLQRLIEESIDVQLLPGAALWSVRVDPSQLEQVILNLVINARDAMPDGGKLTIVTENRVLKEQAEFGTSLVVPGEYVQLSVSDTGGGIDVAVIDNIFEPFFTTKGGKGTGLGLATVYGIVRQSSGHVHVRSDAALGTRFDVLLPRYDAEVDEDEQERRLSPSSKPEATVLVVEDDELVRDW